MAIAWGDTDFGVAYLTPFDAVTFRHVSTAGVAEAPLGIVDSGTKSQSTSYLSWIGLAKQPSQNWAIPWEISTIGGEDVFAKTLNTAGVKSGEFDISFNGSHLRIASSGSSFGAVWHEEDNPGGIQLSLRSSSFIEQTPKTLSSGASGSDPVIAPNAAGFGVGWLDGANAGGATTLKFSEVKLDGTVTCSAPSLDGGTFVPDEMVSTSRGYLMVSGHGKVEVVEMLAGCTWGQRFTVDAGPAAQARIATGNKGSAVVWDVNVGNVGDGIATRTFGANFCN